MPRYTKVATFRSTRRSFRLIVFSLLLFIVSLLFLRKLCEFNGKPYCFHKAEPPSYLEKIKPPVPHRSPVNTKGPTVNLIVGTVLGDDISWTSEITIPNLKIIRYVWDDPKAEYHPARKKGREAMMYHTYFRDFYDNLPDISILIHAHERPWHAESFLFNSLSYTISSLDLDQVVKRKYVNLRIGWQDGCPNWINTTVSTTDSTSAKQEEPFMRQAFLDNFASRNFRGTKGNLTVPEIFAQPCCSQFAVTRDTIRAIPLKDYSFYITWLSKTPLPDHISGRVWEHFWQYLFTGKAVDCPIEWKTLCRMYGVCFENPSEMERFRQLEIEKDWLIFGLRGFGGFWRELRNPDRVGRERGRIRDIDVDMGMRLGQAVNKGLEQGPPAWRDRMGDLCEE